MPTEQLPPCWQEVSDAFAAGIEHIIFYGPPGTGKTYGGLTMGGNPLAGSYRTVCSEDMTAADVTGHFMPSANGEWLWNDGAVLSAWKAGGRVVADEIDRASGDVLSLLLAMFDSPESASWTHPSTKTTYRPKEGFSVVMTTNLENMEDLPTALKDRFPVAIRINQPHPNALLVLDEDLRNAASKSMDLPEYRRISMRGWKEFSRMRKVLGDERAATLVFRDRAHDILSTIRVESVTA